MVLRMTKMKRQVEELPNEFDKKDKSLHINFWLNNNVERKMLDDLAKDNGLTASAYLRFMIIKNWKIKQNGTQDV